MTYTLHTGLIFRNTDGTTYVSMQLVGTDGYAYASVSANAGKTLRSMFADRILPHDRQRLIRAAIVRSQQPV